jgi:hypothetical protein
MQSRISYNEGTGLYEYKPNDRAELVQERMKDGIWNETQLALIIETVANFIELCIEKSSKSLLACSLGIKLLKALKGFCQSQDKNDPKLLDVLYAIYESPNLDHDISVAMPPIAQLVCGMLNKHLQLRRLQERPISKKQEQDGKKFAQIQLAEAISVLKGKIYPKLQEAAEAKKAEEVNKGYSTTLFTPKMQKDHVPNTGPKEECQKKWQKVKG